MTGYPADKPEGSLWSTTCDGTQFSYVDPADNLLRHSCDSTHGQSGSAMFDSGRNVRAVLTGGNDEGKDITNWAIKVAFCSLTSGIHVELVVQECSVSPLAYILN